MSRRPYHGPSDSQANADALARRDTPYSAASEASFHVAWDWHRREPRDLRDAVDQVRKHYAEEPPLKLHEGPGSIDEGGTPKMTSRAMGYMFGSPSATDHTDPGEAISYYLSPFRARMAFMAHGDEPSRNRAAIVERIAIGSHGVREAAQAQGVPLWCAKVVVEDALRVFLGGMSAVKVNT